MKCRLLKWTTPDGVELDDLIYMVFLEDDTYRWVSEPKYYTLIEDLKDLTHRRNIDYPVWEYPKDKIEIIADFDTEKEAINYLKLLMLITTGESHE